MNDKLVPTKNRFGTIQKFGIAARLENAQTTTEDATKSVNRIGIVFDDSGSMSGDKIVKAHEGLDTFIKNCNRNDTSLALYPLNAKKRALTLDYAAIGLYGTTIPATGGTPLYAKLIEMLNEQPITRAVAFSDGAPTGYGKDDCYRIYKEKKVPVDAIFIGYDTGGEKVMQELAEMTGGIYLHFTDPSTLAKSLKYLTPAYRALLMNPEIKAKVERGEL